MKPPSGSCSPPTRRRRAFRRSWRTSATTIAAWDDAPPSRVVVVDDGSTDDTADAARRATGLDVEVLVHAENRGLGAAMRTGIEHVLDQAGAEDLLVTMDADHTHPPSSSRRWSREWTQGADLVIASRFQPGASVHGLDGLRGRTTSLLRVVAAPRPLPRRARLHVRLPRVPRVASCRWGARATAAHFLNQPGFSVMVDLLLKLRRSARRIDGGPLTLRYDRKQSTSKMKLAELRRGRPASHRPSLSRRPARALNPRGTAFAGVHSRMGTNSRRTEDQKPAREAAARRSPRTPSAPTSTSSTRRSVQEPSVEVEFFDDRRTQSSTSRKPKVLREDFCGTFAVSCEWARKPGRIATAVDLDPEPLAWGREHNLGGAGARGPDARARSCRTTSARNDERKADVLAAQNFSYWIF